MFWCVFVCGCVYIYKYIYKKQRKKKKNKKQIKMALNFHPLVIIDVLVGLQNPEIWTWCFFQHWENFFWVPPVPEGLVGWCQPCAITTAPKNLLSIFLVNRAKDWAVDATAKADWERGHVKPHQWFLSPPFFFFSLVCFPLWYLNLFF